MSCSTSPGVGRPPRPPSARQLSADTALAYASTSSISPPGCPRQPAAKAPRKASPAPVLSTQSTGKAAVRISRPLHQARLPSAPSVAQTSAAPNSRRDRVERPSQPLVSGQRGRKLLRRDDGIDVLKQIADAGPDFLDVDDRRDAGVSRVPRRLSRRRRFMTVDDQHAPRGDRRLRDIGRVPRQGGMPIPQHGALARSRIDQDDGKLIRGARNGSRGADVHAVAHQTLPRQRTQFVVSKRSDVARPPPESRARRRRRRDLAAGQPGEPLQTLLGVRRRVLGDDGHQVDAVQAKTGDVEGLLVGGWDGERHAHDAAS